MAKGLVQGTRWGAPCHKWLDPVAGHVEETARAMSMYFNGKDGVPDSFDGWIVDRYGTGRALHNLEDDDFEYIGTWMNGRMYDLKLVNPTYQMGTAEKLKTANKA